MRRIVILTAIGLLLISQIEAKKVKGTIFLENDTLEVMLKIPVKLFTGGIKIDKLQFRVKYIDMTGKKVTLYPYQVKEYRFKYEYEKYRMISVDNSMGLGMIHTTGDKIFLHLKIDGKLKLLIYYNSVTMPDPYNLATGRPLYFHKYFLCFYYH